MSEPEARATEDRRAGSPSPLRIGELLSRNGHIDPSDLALALSEQDLSSNSPPLGRVLLRLGVIDETTLTATLAEQFGLQVVDLDREGTPDPSALARMTREAAHRLQALPLRYEDGELVVVVGEPPTRATKREIVSLSGRQPVFVLAGATPLARAIDDWFPHPGTFVDEPFVDEPLDDAVPVLDIEPCGDEVHTSQASVHRTSDRDANFDIDPPAFGGVRADDRVVGWLLTHATELGATSVHLIEEPTKLRVRVRVDRTMWETTQLPADAATILVRRVLGASGIRSDSSDPERGSIPAIPGVRREWHVRSHTHPAGRVVVLRLARPVAPSV